MPDPSFRPLGSPFIELQSVDSTNNYALTQVHAGLAPHGTAFFAHDQHAGKGQRGKTWSSEKGNNLILSIVLNPHPLTVSQQFMLSACVAVSACSFLKKYIGEDSSSIKWPNDLYWQDRKAGGILIENVVGGQPAGNSNWNWAIIGIGININQLDFPPALKNPVSLRQITGKTFDAVSLARDFCLVLDQNFNQLRQDFDSIYQAYLGHLYKKDQSVVFKKGNRRFEALVKTVTPAGHLVVQHAMEEEFSVGDLEWVM